MIARGVIKEDDVDALEMGIVLDDQRTAPAIVEVLGTDRNETHALITIHEGRKRQIRRMFEAVGHPVKRLSRTRVGPIVLGNIRLGRWRHLTPEELATLRSAVGLSSEGENRQA